MNILLVSHTDSINGAGLVFLKMAERLRDIGHEVHCVVPTGETRQLIDRLQSKNIKFSECELRKTLPDFPSYLIVRNFTQHNDVSKILSEDVYDFVITNTIATLDFAIECEKNKIPHYFYCHELIEKSPEICPTGISSIKYMELIFSLSEKVLCGSEWINLNLKKYGPEKVLTLDVLHWGLPHENFSIVAASDGFIDRIRLVNIGALSSRKNALYGLKIVMSMRAMGFNVEYTIIGDESNHGNFLRNKIVLWELQDFVKILPHQDDPYLFLEYGSVLTVFSKEEPYGMVLPEALRRGVPVISTPVGAALDFFPLKNCIDLENVATTVNLLLKIYDDYDYQSKLALEFYNKRISLIKDEHLFDILSSLAIKITQTQLKSACLSNQFLYWLVPRTLHIEQLIINISNCLGVTVDFINQQINQERSSPGLIIRKELLSFDVTPYHYNEKMDDFYRNGHSFIYELLTYAYDFDRLRMILFVMLYIDSLKSDSVNLSNVLAVGDGLGLDAIRLASYGLNVHYFEYEDSVMGRVGKNLIDFYKSNDDNAADQKNIEVVNSHAARNSYDAIICFEVLEHVKDPSEFVTFLNSKLRVGGYLFLSECLDGIRMRWPTHLFNNEEFGPKLELFMYKHGFELIASNIFPKNKPYVFTKIF